MEWADFVDKELHRSSVFDNTDFTMAGANLSGGVPPVIRISISLLERFLKHGEKRLVIVFPEGKKIPFLFLLAQLLSDVFDGGAEIEYDPDKFVLGQKLKFQKFILEFSGTECGADGISRICVKTGDGVIKKIPMTWAPYFQQTDTNRHLSKDREVSHAMNDFRLSNQGEKRVGSAQIVETLTNNITHFTGTIFCAVSSSRINELCDTTAINHVLVRKLLLIGSGDAEGNIQIKGAGQLAGTPAIVYAPDLYAILEAIKKGASPKMLLVDGTNQSTATKQLSALDELIQLDFPIVYTTDTANSLELANLEDRGFYIWRWDESNLTQPLQADKTSSVGRRICNCANKTLQYIRCNSQNIDRAFDLLLRCRQMTDDATTNYVSSYTKLLSLAFRCIRAVQNFDNSNRQKCLDVLRDAQEIITTERKFNPAELASSMEEADKALLAFFNAKGDIPKVSELKNVIDKNANHWKNVCLIIADDADREANFLYWQRYILNKHLGVQIHIARQDEYVHDNNANYDATIVCGWIRRDKMCQILYGNATRQCTVLLYGYEMHWKNPQVNWWSHQLHKNCNEKISSKMFPEIHIHSEEIENAESAVQSPPADELESISLTIQKAQYGHYITGDETHSADDATEAVPISFVGNCFAFFKPSHKIIDVTDIVLGKKAAIHMIDPESLDTGNFVVVREASRDIIRELADQILDNSDMSGKRLLASKWKESLEMESLFSSTDEICRKIQQAGCQKNIFTIRQWVKSEDRIIPQDKEDLRYQDELPLITLEALDRTPLQYDRIVIDEAQDIIGSYAFDVLDVVLKNGLARGKWFMFGDFTNQAIFDQSIEPEKRLAELEDTTSFIKFRLKINCRNTKQIGDEIRYITGFDSSAYLWTKVTGVPVEYKTYNTPEDELQILQAVLDKLIKDGVEPGKITILSPFKRESSVVSAVTRFEIRDYKPEIHDMITFSTVQSYKGLENAVIILADVDTFSHEKLMYVGLSRARSGLYILETEAAEAEHVQLLMKAVIK